MIFVIIVAALIAVLGIIVIIGKGDNLIAGYNTASKAEKAKYDIKRLRILIGGLMLVIALLMFLLLRKPTMPKDISFSLIVFFLCIAVVILANTWAKKKKKKKE